MKTSVDAKHGPFAKRRLTETRHKLERIYGKGLVGLKDEHGRIDSKRFSWDTSRVGGEYYNIGGQVISAASTTAVLYGLI